MAAPLSKLASNELRAKRAELARRMGRHQREMERCEDELIHIDEVLRFFGAQSPPTNALPKKYRRCEYLIRDEICHRCLAAMHHGATITAELVVVKLMKDKGLDPNHD